MIFDRLTLPRVARVATGQKSRMLHARFSVSNSHTKFDWIFSNCLRISITDGQTDVQTDVQTDGGDYNSPCIFLKKTGDNHSFPLNCTRYFNVIMLTV